MQKIASRSSPRFKRNKTFIQKHYPFVELYQEMTDQGRFYISPEGHRLPSVTTVLGRVLDKSGLQEWRDRVGEVEANKITTQAANRGTAIHSIAEKYLLNQDTYPPRTMPVNIETFLKLQGQIDQHIDVIHAIEAPLYSLKLRTAGRTDCVATWDGVPSIVDFKTSRKLKREDWIESYFLQATAYSIMFEELTGVNIPQFVILVAVDHEEPQVFIKSTDNYKNKVIDLFTKAS